ncbi:iron complex outermembrane receptor protein [Mitsuaria sp. BK045]|uniref:TonB-dependent receptor n=1 Tax=unclassified Roseateles TaxID=2626991 RepID=UPI001623168E|nr:MULTISPECIES: TonB-dependent receptor [unclassified Roseateles]MBB3293111.1 iron complex outermembrane receptor protein [Mitsuaria sp. BK041]MBB3362328.1 iron complex outermembrane receptor protein [Mitsuaria sp. BK045]
MANKPRFPFLLSPISLALALGTSTAWAQQAPVASTADAAAPTGEAANADTAAGGAAREHKHKLDVVVVTGNPLSQRELAAPVQALSGDALTLKRGASLGDTLDGLAGVGSTYFGPNSNRPTMRGLDGDRVRMLSNSGASVDASSLSFDHALPVDPLVLTRVEVLRGAAALQYGGNAIGGVVNAIDNRIPRLAQPGLNGVAELRLGGASDERGGAVVLDGGSNAFAWHVDAADRRADDQRVPRFTSEDGSSTRVRNSDAHGRSGAVGGSLLFSQGYAGVSVEDYHNEYGVTVEPDVRIQMQRQRLATAGEWRDPLPGLARVTWQFASSRYKHQEVEGSGEIGTVFESDGKDGRVEATHAAFQGGWGSVQGVLGWQWDQSDFSALGEEALVPGTKTRSNALFLIEQFKSGPWSLQAGARAERVSVASTGGDEERFGDPVTRRFSPKSLSLSGAYDLGQGFSLSSNLSSGQRAPTFYELFANGVHVASGAFEVGDVNLGLERAKAVDLGLHWKQGEAKWSLQVYQTRFSNYIALDASGRSVELVGEDGGTETVPEYLYRGVRARMHGIELEGRQPLPAVAGWGLTLGTTLDLVRGTNRDTGEPLPRLAPVRASLSIQAERGPWLIQAELRGARRQDRVPALDTPTAGYGILRLNIARHFDIGNLDAMWYLKLDNLANKLAYNAGSVQTIRELTPLPGRSVFAGLQVKF